MAEGGLYETRRREGGWSPRVKLPAEVNVNGSEIGAVFSPSGKSLLFPGTPRVPNPASSSSSAKPGTNHGPRSARSRQRRSRD